MAAGGHAEMGKRKRAGCLGWLAALLIGGLLGVVFLGVGLAVFFGGQPDDLPQRARQWLATDWPQVISSQPAALPATRPAPATATPAYDPVSWKELVAFITEDHTNWKEYQPDQYVCLNFAIELVNNAHQQQIPAWVVAVFFENEEIGHAFVAFQTADKGLVYIEPQTDIPYIQPQIGRPLCDLWTGQNCLGVIETIEYLSCDVDGRCLVIDPPPVP